MYTTRDEKRWKDGQQERRLYIKGQKKRSYKTAISHSLTGGAWALLVLSLPEKLDSPTHSHFGILRLPFPLPPRGGK